MSNRQIKALLGSLRRAIVPRVLRDSKTIAGIKQAEWNIGIEKAYRDRQRQHPNPLTRFGAKCFSQADEDGITLEIVRRLQIENGTFAEFGVGDGMENNTLILAALGWRGFWIGGEGLAIDWKRSKHFDFIQAWITAENAVSLFKRGRSAIAMSAPDVVSIDLDGNDIYITEELLKSGVTPKLFIVEYNGKFPPPVRFKIEYDPKHTWQQNDYYGASICSYTDMFSKYGYTLICCNAGTGVNAFFVKDEYKQIFDDIPNNITSLYSSPFFFVYRNFAHKPSISTIEAVINRIE